MPMPNQPQLNAGLFGRRGVGMPQPGARSPKPPAPRGPAGVRIEHRVGVNASPQAIWDVVRDLARWGEWNPLYPMARGEVRIGGTLRLARALPGAEPRPLTATVLEWVPCEQLHWRTSSLHGLVRVIHYVEIEALAEQSCIVTCGEIVGGLLGNTAARQTGGLVRRGLTGMNEALKARAEAAWRDAAERPTS